MKNPWPLIEELKLPNTENKKSQVKGQKRQTRSDKQQQWRVLRTMYIKPIIYQTIVKVCCKLIFHF